IVQHRGNAIGPGVGKIEEMSYHPTPLARWLGVVTASGGVNWNEIFQHAKAVSLNIASTLGTN
ncbi:MAG: hypothetical protein RLZZ366_431, partial [Pseudomonadota bacterium]